MSRRKVAIVGGGALGLGCALALAGRDDVDVAVIERGHPGAGSSSLAVGMAIRTQRRPLERALAFRSYEILEDLAATAGLPLRRVGTLLPAHDDEDIGTFGEIVEAEQHLGHRATRVLDRVAMSAGFPDIKLADDVVGAAWDRDAFYIDGNELCTILAGIVRQRGVGMITRAEVTGLTLGARGTKYTVETTAGGVPADIVVNAGGAWSGLIGSRLGAPVATVNERHEAYVFRTSPTRTLLPMMLDYIPGRSSHEGLYFRSEGPDRIVAGMHSSDLLHRSEGDIEDYSKKLDESQMEIVFGLLTEALPSLELGFEGGWCGLYPHHIANRYVLGPHPQNPDVLIGAGLGGRGLGPAVALGEILADWVVHGQPVRFPGAAALAPPDQP